MMISKTVVYVDNHAKYRVIHKSVKHFKNSQQIGYATDHGNSYVDRERETIVVFLRKSPCTLLP